MIHWRGRVCLVDRDHQLRLLGIVSKDPLEGSGHFPIGRKETCSEVR